MSTIIDGTAGITFPVTAGSASAVQASSGRVLQVVNATYSTYTSIGSSSTLVDLGLSATITPSSSSNKILIFTDLAGGTSVNSVSAAFNVKLLRGSTAIVNIENSAGYGGVTERDFGAFGSSSYLDSPSTTSATTYKIQVANTGGVGNLYVNNYTASANGSTCTMTLMEIAA